MNITSGVVQRAQKCVIYGPEGIGKSTFASQFPNPLFIDTEGSTFNLDVHRFDRPTSWTMLMQQVDHVLHNPGICGTLVIDTADWAEALCKAEVCATNHVAGIEDFGYGKGYTYTAEAFGKLLNRLEDLVGLGVNVCVTAHATMRKFEQPDEMGAYDRWEMKLSKQCAPLLKEWTDMLLFANYKTVVVQTKDGAKKGTGGKRVMYTTHHPCWDGKNRFNLPDEIPFLFDSIAYCIPTSAPQPASAAVAAQTGASTTDAPKTAPAKQTESSAPPVEAQQPDMSGIPKTVADLMAADNITEESIRHIVSDKGYYPYSAPISNYDPDFISGWIVPFWKKIVELAKKDEVPF